MTKLENSIDRKTRRKLEKIENELLKFSGERRTKPRKIIGFEISGKTQWEKFSEFYSNKADANRDYQWFVMEGRKILRLIRRFRAHPNVDNLRFVLMAYASYKKDHKKNIKRIEQKKWASTKDLFRSLIGLGDEDEEEPEVEDDYYERMKS